MRWEKLKLAHDSDALGIDGSEWRARLAEAAPDASVGIRHAVVKGDAVYRIHVAAIPKQVGCHFHADGDEDYAVVAGEGMLHWGRARATADGYQVEWETPVAVKEGDRFVIPEGYAHQLRRRGKGELIILFGCPDSHLDDRQDRTMLGDAPTEGPDPIRQT